MKKLIICLLLAFGIYQLKAQESVTFKMKYSPDKNYDANVNMDMNFKVTLAGDTAIINKLKSQGIAQPMALNMEMTMKGNVKTGPANTSKTFPIAINFHFDKMDMAINGNAIPIPTDKLKSNTTIFGHVGVDGKIKADSIGGGKLKDTSEKAVSQMLNNIQNNIKFPDHPLRVGDTFTQDMPMNIPIAGNNLNASSKTVYKLVSIANGNGYFDVDQSMDMKVPVKNDSITLAGTGKGKVIYNLKESFMTDFTTDMELKFDGKISTLQINGTASMKIEYANTIN